MPFYRLTTPAYFMPVPWPPPGYQYINNDPASPPNQAPAAPVVASGGAFDGSYFIDFGEDAYSANGNRTHQVLAENTDYLDDVVSYSIPVVTNRLLITVGLTATRTVTGEVFVGDASTLSVRELFSVVDPATNNELLHPTTAERIHVSNVDDGAGGAVLGNGFQTNPRVFFTPSIPTGITFRLVCGERGSYKDVSLGATAGGLVRESIASAHLVPGEVGRVIAEIMRRAPGPGAVASLQTTLIETPTTGNPLLGAGHNVMTLDVDSEGNHAGGGELRVTFSGGGAVLTVKEWAGPSMGYWGSSSPIALYDSNMVSQMATPQPVFLTTSVASYGDAVIRQFESDPTALGPNDASIFKSINARFKVTVGDGVKTFGDYNGLTAIADALIALSAMAPGLAVVHIQVKEGTYDSFHAAPLPSGAFTLEGVGAASVVELDASIALPKLTLRNLQLSNTSGGPVVITTVSGLVVDGCRVLNVGFVVNTYASGGVPIPFTYHLVDSVFTNTHYHVMTIAAQTTDAVASSCVMERCQVTMLGERTVLVVDSLAPGVTYFEGILFSDCELNLSGTNTVGGNLGSNVGVCWLNPRPSGPVVRDITFRDCRVNANWNGTGNNSILLYIRTVDGAGGLVLEHLKIEGGVWSCPGQDTRISPFYIGGGTATDLVLRPRKVTIKDVRWGFESGTYTTINPHGVGTTEVGKVVQSAFYINAAIVSIHNLSFISLLCKSGSARDLHLYQAQMYDVDGIFMNTFVDNPSIALYAASRVQVDGLPSAASPSYEGSLGCIRGLNMEGGTVAAVCADGRAALTMSPNGRLALRDSSFMNLGTVGTGGAISIQSGVSWEGCGAEITGCHIEKVPGSGIDFFGLTGHSNVTRMTIRACSISRCGLHGVDIRSVAGLTINEVVIADNKITLCTEHGLWFAPDAWGHSVMVKDNQVQNNNEDALKTQMLFGSSGIDADAMYGLVMGNECRGVSGGGGANPINAGVIYFFTLAKPRKVMGAETYYREQSADIYWWGTDNQICEYYIDGGVMFRNYALLGVGISPP